jgi:CHAD domain-containing protein
MSPAASKLDRPALDVVARIARRQLRAADEAWQRVESGQHETALHDFRVALRRLRSTVRAYGPQLDDVLRKKDRRRLQRLADATSQARDAEVQIAHLRALRGDLGASDQAAVALLLRALRRRMRDGYTQADRVVSQLYPKTARAVRDRLKDAAAGDVDTPFRAVLGQLLSAHARDLRPLLEQVPAIHDVQTLHQTRIEVKRVRYLLEPLRRLVPGSALLIGRLARLQDLLGELHDYQVLEQTIGAPRLSAIERREAAGLTRVVRERQRRLYGELAREWLGEHAVAVLAPLDLLTERLGTGRRGPLALRSEAARRPRRVVAARRA